MTRRLVSVLIAVVLMGSLCPCALSDDSCPAGTVRQETILVGSMERTFLAYIPRGELPSPALIIVLHGSLGSGAKMREMSAFQFDALAEREGCIVVYPDGYHRHWNDCRTVPRDDAHTENIDDVGFMSALIDTCRARWHCDPGRVYAAGLSNGGHMCFRLAAEIPQKIAGICAMGASMPEPGSSRCPAPAPGMPVVIMNGTQDPINPYAGGMVKLFIISKGMVLSSLDSALAWLKPEDRGRTPVKELLPDIDTDDGTTVERATWPGSAVWLYTVRNGGHTIPGGEQYLPAFLVGRTCRDMDAAREAWRCFTERPGQ